MNNLPQFPEARPEQIVHFILHEGRSDRIPGGPKRVSEIKCPRCKGNRGICCPNDVPSKSDEMAWFCTNEDCFQKDLRASKANGYISKAKDVSAVLKTEPQKSYSTPWEDDLW